ncbi:acriflavine resistance protein B [Aspergillus luchuensis]|uniref:Acriflavine resistance protein B n=1 Tax=Aspergillus kawachii TaxID=1069201 RepID=A0A146F6K2_ASPKA|nr:acriflavine resistance protein B [Aspergillus luchuensis]
MGKKRDDRSDVDDDDEYGYEGTTFPPPKGVSPGKLTVSSSESFQGNGGAASISRCSRWLKLSLDSQTATLPSEIFRIPSG